MDESSSTRKTTALIGALYEHYSRRALLAVRAASRLERAVFPILHHTKGFSSFPEQTGSCVAFCADDEVFLLGAAHVFESFGQYPLLVAGMRHVYVVGGDRFSSKQGPSGTHQDDTVDAAVFHITGEVPNELRANALLATDIDIEGPGDGRMEFYVAAGYCSSRSKRRGKTVHGIRELFPTSELPAEEYDEIGVSRQTHIALAYEDEVFVNGHWGKSPKLNGMSGGAIIRARGLFPHPSSQPPAEIVPVLSAVTTEHKKKGGRRLPVVAGARVGYHMFLINQFLPGLLKISALSKVLKT